MKRIARKRGRPVAKTPTEAQVETVVFIHRFRAEHEVSPTEREIAAHFGITHSSVRDRLWWLELRGLVRRGPPRAARSVRLSQEGLALAARGM